MKERVALPSAHLARELQALRFASREPRGRFAERQVAQPKILEHPEPCRHRLHVARRPKRRRDVHVHEFGQRMSGSASFGL